MLRRLRRSRVGRARFLRKERTIRSGQVRLEGRHVVVTGAGNGIGQAIAERLAEGATLTLLAPTSTGWRGWARPIDARADAPATSAAGRAVDGRSPRPAAARGPIKRARREQRGRRRERDPAPGDRFDELVAHEPLGTYRCCARPSATLARRAGHRRDRVDPGAHRRARLHGLLRLQGRAARPGALARRRARPARRAGQRHLPRLGRHRHGLAGHRGMAKGLGISREAAFESCSRCPSAA